MKPHFKTVGEVKLTNDLWIGKNSLAIDAAMKLVETSFQGMMVLNSDHAVVGKITELDLLKALKTDKDMNKTKVHEIMEPNPSLINTETPLELVVDLMARHKLIRVPVIRDGVFIGSITRHDLLRAWLGLWNPRERGDGYA